MNPLFLNTVLLGGDTRQKLTAAAQAGFDQVELWTSDVDALSHGVGEVGQIAADLSIGFTDYQVLLDFDGAPADRRDAKRAEALAMLDTATALGIETVLVPASTDPKCDPTMIHADLAWLVDEAKMRGRRIAYEAMAWSTVNHTLASAWKAIRDFDPLHAGLVIDAYHLFGRNQTEEAIDDISVNRIFLAQFSDIARPVSTEDAKQVGRHNRLLPGQGVLPLRSLCQRLLAHGYRGPIGLEVFNDMLRSQDPHQVAIQAMRSLDLIIR